MFTIAQETVDDWHEIELLFDTCFAPGREALSSYRLREGVPPVARLSLLVRDGYGSVAGAIRYWPVAVGDAPCLLLGPVAVHPTHQGEGLGGLLINDSLARAAADSWERVILIGDAPYYNRYGFTRNDALIFPPPTNPDRLLTRELVPGAFDGITGEVRQASGPCDHLLR